VKVILLNDVPKVGRRNEVRDVSSGYALNFLIPRGMAKQADAGSVKKLEHDKATRDEKKKKEDEILARGLDSIKGMTLEMTKKANDKGHLFASVHVDEIVALIKERTGLDLDPSHIDYDKPIKELGEHELGIKASDKQVNVKILLK